MPYRFGLEHTPNSDWRLRELSFAAGSCFLAGYHRTGERQLANGTGRRLWLLNPPEVRDFASHFLLRRRPVRWDIDQTDAGVAIRSSQSAATADIVELGCSAAKELDRPPRPYLAVAPTCEPLRGYDDLAAYLIGRDVLAPGGSQPFPRYPIDQTNLSLYRLARWHGGPFWDGVANHIASVTLHRVEKSGPGGPVTDLWGQQEVHVRFLADAILLLAAYCEQAENSRVDTALDKACDALESFRQASPHGPWLAHDSIELASGRTNLVLNTHIHGMMALHAACRDVAALRSSLDGALHHSAKGAAALAVGLAMGVSDLARANLPRRLATPAVVRARKASAKVARDGSQLQLPGGWIARDATGEPAPDYYFAVNMNDVAVAHRNLPSAALAQALRGSLRYSTFSQYEAAERRWHERLPPTVMPAVLRNAGKHAAAERAGELALARGFHPLIGWPGHIDHLWTRLAPGTP